ncbi:MAG TPA: hypothetical protein VIK75_09730 [Calditerricola sp.]
MTPGTIVQIYHPRYMGRIGKVVGRNGDKLLVLIDGKTVRVDADKVLLVKAKQTA